MEKQTSNEIKPEKARFSRGFALVITLTLMVLLALLAVGLLSLANVTMKTTASGNDMAIARGNARLALALAIGQLQKNLGTDKAITANGELLENNPAKKNLIGVWESWNLDPSAGSAPNYQNEKDDRFKTWLASTKNPQIRKDKDFINSEWDTSTGTIELIGKHSLGGQASNAQKAQAELIPVVSNNGVKGAYAWHVSDESQKARINHYRDPGNGNLSIAEQRNLLIGHRPDASVIKNSSAQALNYLPQDKDVGTYTQAKKMLGKIVNLEQASLLQGASVPAEVFRWDVTPYSLGVLADVRRGGLQKDLSSIFELTTDPTQVKLPAALTENGDRLYQSSYGLTGISDPYWSTLASYYNSFRSLQNETTEPVYSQAPQEAISLSNPVAPKAFYAGPVIEKIDTYFTFMCRDNPEGTGQTLGNSIRDYHNDQGHDPNEPIYTCYLLYVPIVTLHNPYNVNIQFDKLKLSIYSPPVGFQMFVNGNPQTPVMVPLSEMISGDANRNRGKSFHMEIGNWASSTSTSTSKPVVMQPGQTIVCGPMMSESGALFTGAQRNMENDNTGTESSPLRAGTNFSGVYTAGFFVSWIQPRHGVYGANRATRYNGPFGNLPLHIDDIVTMQYGLLKQESGTGEMKESYFVKATLTAAGKTVEYGGQNFYYGNQGTLNQSLGGEVYVRNFGMPPSFWIDTTKHPRTYTNAQTFAVFSASAGTTRGGVYETNNRVATSGSLNSLYDGKFANQPMLFHNHASIANRIDLRSEKPGTRAFNLNMLPIRNNGELEDIFDVDFQNRKPILTGNRSDTGIKSGTYLEIPGGPMQVISDFRRSGALNSPFMPSPVQPIANSLVPPVMSTTEVRQMNSDVASYELLDHSFLANHALYDTYYFSTVGTVNGATPRSTFESFANGDAIPSQVFRPYLPAGTSQAEAINELYNAAGTPKEDAYQSLAKYQLLEGAFNVNSTNIQAWKAKLAALNGVEIGIYETKERPTTKDLLTEYRKSLPTGTPIPPMTLVNAGQALKPTTGSQIQQATDWNGFRTLDDNQLLTLAEKIVDQVRLRGPFLSLAEFVNRRIGNDSELTRMGALESAIRNSGINNVAFTNQIDIALTNVSNTDHYAYKTPQAATGNPAAGAPGWISQGDLMHVLEPAITVRSDTFVIRVSGEAHDASGKVTARAYAEAVVQRLPEYLDPQDPPDKNVYDNASTASVINNQFGRRFALVSFRWLNSDEI